MPDAIFAHPRLAAVYDAFDGDRSDLALYLSLVEEFGARTVLDVGCGTGTFACALAARGVEVVAVDPAAASLAVACGKPHADGVRWVLGDATSLSPMQVDLATMTGNVAQVFVGDDEWERTLRAVRAALRPGGRLVLESRRPERQAWRGWTPERSRARRVVPGAGAVTSWVRVTGVRGDEVSFRWTFRFEDDEAELHSDSTLRFRSLAEIESSLATAGLEVEQVREAPDRPGHEHVVVARRPTA